MLGFLILVLLIAIPFHLFVAVWLFRDAKARGSDSAGLWVVVYILTGLFGWAAYIMARARGTLIKCPQCSARRLPDSQYCPNCRLSSL